MQVYGQVGHLPPGLLGQLLPGPVTLLLSRQSHAPVCVELNPGVELIGELCVKRLVPPQWLCMDKPLWLIHALQALPLAFVIRLTSKLTDVESAAYAGIRVPDSPFIRAVCRQHGGALALTSANLTGAASPVCVNDFHELWPQCAAVFNAMRILGSREGSTIIDLSAAGHFRVVRAGCCQVEVLQILRGHGLQQVSL